jgi:hypothetical protein
MLSHSVPGVPRAINVGSVTTALVAVVVRDSGVGVSVSVGGRGVDVKDAAVSVNSATTVYAADVRMALMSGGGAMGVAGAQAASRIPIDRTTSNLVFISPLFAKSFMASCYLTIM